MNVRSRRGGAAVVFVLVSVLLAVGIRQVSEQNRPAPPASPVLDDSGTTIPLSPPPVPDDSLEQMREVQGRLASRPPARSIDEQRQAAEMALGIGDLRRAEALLRLGLQSTPRDRAARLMLAKILSQEERLEDAKQRYLELNREDPADLEPYLELESVTLRQNRRDEAWQWLSRGVSQSAQNPENMIALAHRYYYLNDVPAAESALDKAMRMAPADTNVLLKRAIFFFDRKKLAESRALLETVLQAHPDNEPAHRLLAEVLLQPSYPQQDSARANTLLEKAVAEDPKDPEVYRLAAANYERLHLYRMAAQAYTALLTLEPRSADGRYGLGKVYSLLGKPDLAHGQFEISRALRARTQRIAALSSAVSQHPMSATAHAALAEGLEASRDYAGALRERQIAAGLAPGDPGLASRLQKLYNRLGWGQSERSSH